MVKWDNFNSDLYNKVREAKKGQQYDWGHILRTYADINSHLTLDEVCTKFQQKFFKLLN